MYSSYCILQYSSYPTNTSYPKLCVYCFGRTVAEARVANEVENPIKSSPQQHIYFLNYQGQAYAEGKAWICKCNRMNVQALLLNLYHMQF